MVLVIIMLPVIVAALVIGPIQYSEWRSRQAYEQRMTELSMPIGIIRYRLVTMNGTGPWQYRVHSALARGDHDAIGTAMFA